VNINITLFGQMVTFAIFVLFCMKFVWPPIVQAMVDRQKQIEDGLAQADRASRDLELAQEKAAEYLRNAKAEAASIIEASNKRASQIVDEAKIRAREEGDRIVTAAQAEIDREFNHAKEELRSKLAQLSVAGAEKILQSSVDQKVHSDMLSKLAAQL
jgi:F-type H+-transporting ATPase subunit b